MTVIPLGDSAVVMTICESIDVASAARVRRVALEVRRRQLAGLCDIVPVFGRVAVFVDPTQAAPVETLRRELEAAVRHVELLPGGGEARTVEIPVSYGGDDGPDLELVASLAGLSPQEVVIRHSAGEYVVHAIGFAPGFPYLGGLPPELAVPRRGTPRSRVAAGSVGIGGNLTGIYPLETPGGWNLIGRTPLKLFDAGRPEASLLNAGDRVKFRAITTEEFHTREKAQGAPPHPPGDAPGTAAAPHIPVGIEVVRAGMFTTVQDLGRRGHRAQGVPLSGAADTFALRVANLLVGNHENEAGLEFTLVGPELTFLHDTVVALGGAEFGRLPRWQPIPVSAGSTLTIGASRNGARGCLAVAGGIAVPPVLGSRSTYVRGRLGGHQGRRLTVGDLLPVPDVQRTFRDHWHIDERIMPRYASFAVVRVIPGEHAEQFDSHWTDCVFKVSTQSDRMGVRLLGEPLRRNTGGEMLSTAVAPGTIQVPPDGQPIVLLADAQTIGGYPQVAHVVSVDLPVMAQLRPGDEVRFVAVSLADAHELILAQERAIGLLREGLAQKLA